MSWDELLGDTGFTGAMGILDHRTLLRNKSEFNYINNFTDNTMPRFKLTIAYNGRNYHGFQIQPKHGSIQLELETALKKILGDPIKITPSGRTDTGVHALSQTLHFDSNKPETLKKIAEQDMVYKLNCVLPDDIAVLELKKSPDRFHARNHSKRKSYIYWLLVSTKKNPFLDELVWHITQPLDVKAMKKAATYLKGEHDFSSFCASDSKVKTKTRKITHIKFTNQKLAPFYAIKGEKYIAIEFVGTGFLKQMVRSLIGTLVAVGLGKTKPQSVKKILTAKDRRKAFQTAPARGLYLNQVKY